MFGSIDTSCEIAPIVESAYNAARDICEYHYMTAPELGMISNKANLRKLCTS